MQEASKDADLKEEMDRCSGYVIDIQTTLSHLRTKLRDLKYVASAGGHHAKPPKLDLPKFTGKWREWTHFWDGFRQVHEGRQFPYIDKIRYLNSCLKARQHSWCQE